jgi:DNA-binding GntR family transcriptional regulator
MSSVTYPATIPPKPPTLKEHVVQLLTQAILSGQIKPGERLVEAHLAARFQVSRAPVRESLLKLQDMGLAISKPRHGIFVVRLDEEELQRINSVRIILEAEALRLCKARCTPESVEILRGLLNQMESSGPQPAVDALQIDINFHRAIWQMTGNHYLDDLLSSLTTPFFAQAVLLMSEEQKEKTILHSHRPMLDFIEGKLNRPAEHILIELLSTRWHKPERYSSLASDLAP